jgi:protein gp37
MGRTTAIEWTDSTWNPIRGCARVSEGCRNCYAEGVAARFSGPGQAYEGLAEFKGRDARWTGKVRFIEKHLYDPLHWKSPRRIFVNSMSDLFHEAITAEQVYRIFMVMWAAHWHSFQILTKRPERMFDLVKAWLSVDDRLMKAFAPDALPGGGGIPRNSVPLENVWLGVSVEDQATANERLPILAMCPARIRFVSYEPALGPVNWERAMPLQSQRVGIDWIIAGGESGPDARPARAEWIRAARQFCSDYQIPFFFKQWGEFLPAQQDGRGKQDLNCSDEPIRIGKHRAGALLDGHEYKEFP